MSRLKVSVNRKTVLLVEDESSIADNIIYSLNLEGIDCRWTALGQESIAILEDQSIDLVILDIGLPDISGFDVCKRIRQFSQVPIIFLTARGEEIDRVVGLEIGADDYVVKPFSMREIVARVKANIRRYPTLEDVQQPGSDGVFEVDEARRIITFYAQALDLTNYEYGILVTLLRQPERVFSRDQLLEAVWQAPEGRFDRVVDTHIKSLRAKLRSISPKHDPLKTHRGVGYSISPIEPGKN